ncbi:MAG: hypothetical protein M3Q86_14985 [Verrucomicrobiota bacterium]|nr:hypothetical protein [Verrucomicrobiota bacterium]
MKPLFLFRPSPVSLASALAVVLAGAGCDRTSDQITVYRIPKETPTPAAPQQAAQGVAAPLAVHWTAPAGWEEQAPSGFRKGSFLVTDAEGKKADVSVISFPEAAGGLLANVNRWRDQLKLAPITDVVQAGTPMEVAGRDMFFVELVSEEPLSPDGSKSRILGAIFPAGAETWFFKMIGPDALVDSQREAFRQFLQSVHPTEGEGAGHAHPPTSANSGGTEAQAPAAPLAAAAPGAPVQYTLPPGWQEKPLSPMRLASFKATAPNGKETDISVVALPGAAGGVLENVNRWRGQVQLGPVDEETLAKTAERVQANGHDFLLVDLASEQPIEGEKQRILAAILDENQQSWFIKMTGEDAAVASQKSAFTDFLRGLKIP